MLIAICLLASFAAGCVAGAAYIIWLVANAVPWGGDE